jgi:hypothetical protein
MNYSIRAAVATDVKAIFDLIVAFSGLSRTQPFNDRK